MTFTYSLASLANNANALVSSISVNASAITSLTANSLTLNYVSSNGSVGTNGQVLTSAGAGSNVDWATSSGLTTGKSIAMAIVFGG